MTTRASTRFTGWHMFAVLCAFFGTVIAVNLTMARYAISSFGGIQVENSYVASQNFNQWLDAAAEQEALGWEVSARRSEGQRLVVVAEGPGAGATLVAHARHPLGRQPDRSLTFTRQADGSFLSDQRLDGDRWIVRLEMADGAQVWKREDRL